MSEDNKTSEDFILEAESELRFKIEKKDVKVYITLNSGCAEYFGTALVMGERYEFTTGAEGAIFTLQGCVLNVHGRADLISVSKNTAMVQYFNSLKTLEQMRAHAEKNDRRGPIAMIVGSRGVGKSTLCRIFLNYAVRHGRRVLYVDLDAGQGSISIPGTMSSILIERPASIEEGFQKPDPLIYHFGHNSPSGNSALHKAVIAKMAEVSLEAIKVNKRTKHSGIIINTCGWVTGEGYKQILYAVESFQVNAIVVIGQESLYNNLLRNLPPFMRVVLLPKSGGVVERNKDLRKESRELRIKEYFYGSRVALYPFSIEVKFADLRLYKYKNTKLVAVTPTSSLLNHILAVSFAENVRDDVIGTNVAGFVCVTEVDIERQVVIILSIQPQLLPNKLLLLSELQLMDKQT